MDGIYGEKGCREAIGARSAPETRQRVEANGEREDIKSRNCETKSVQSKAGRRRSRNWRIRYEVVIQESPTWSGKKGVIWVGSTVQIEERVL